MAEDRVKRKGLWQKLDQVKQRDWLKAGKNLGLFVSSTQGKGSHGVIRDSKFSVDNPKGLVTTVQRRLYKEANQGIFKNFLHYGFEEDDIWRALKFLK